MSAKCKHYYVSVFVSLCLILKHYKQVKSMEPLNIYVYTYFNMFVLTVISDYI